MTGVLSIFRPKVLAGLLALPAALAFVTSDGTADQWAGPVLRAPIRASRSAADAPSEARFVVPEGRIGSLYEPTDDRPGGDGAEQEQAEPSVEPEHQASDAAEPKDASPKAESQDMSEAETEAESEAEPEEAPKAEPEPRPELSPEMAALRDRVRRTLAGSRRAWFNTRDHSVTDILHICLGYGCGAQVRNGSSSGKAINAITCLCWNYPCRGKSPLMIAEGHIAGRIGYGLQTERSQMLAVLAQAQVPPEYPARVGEDVRTVADLVEYEKLTCREGIQAPLKLIGLSFYIDDDATWENDLGETWSLERLVEEALKGATLIGSARDLDRLMGLSCAVQWRVARKQPIEGAFENAARYTRQFHDHALKCQNPDGSWNPAFFGAVGPSRDTAGVLASSGRITEWLAQSLPADRLEDPQVVRAVTKLNSILATSRYQSSAARLNSQEVGSMMHGLRALALYDQRVFRPADPPPEPAEAEPAVEKQVRRTTRAAMTLGD